MSNNLLFLSTRKGFNSALNHFKTVTALLNDFQRKNNLADILNNLLNSDKITVDQIVPILNISLVDKFDYFFKSVNMQSGLTDNFSKIAEITRKWDLLDFVMLYHHPQLGQLVINPKNEKSWENLQGGLKENELIIIYAGNFNGEFSHELAELGVNALISLLYNEKAKDEKLFASSTSTFKPSKEPKKKKSPVKEAPKILAPAAVQPKAPSVNSAKKRLSPEFGITVTNELFHNGNVEAWKKIIESYEMKYPDLKVVIFYEREEIKDINTLFKWGKVKHGTMIILMVLGVEFKDVSKLRRYLFEGASPKFENFLKGAPGQMLLLF